MVQFRENATQVDQGLRQYLLTVYKYMAAGIGMTALTAYGFIRFGLIEYLYNFGVNQQGQFSASMSPLGWIVMIAPLIMVIYMSFKFTKISSHAAKAIFYVYSVMVGASISLLLLSAGFENVARAFAITAATFLGMSIYGYTTNRDLTAVGSFAIMGLIGIIIAAIVNMFIGSLGLSFAIDVLAVVIFTALTAYDVQKLKRVYYSIGGTGEMAQKIAIYGALGLYLDFINIFLSLLRLMGGGRD